MSIRVLVIDPDESIVDAFANSLKRHGFEVLTASTERDCLRELCESAPDVVILEPDGVGSWGRKFLSMQDIVPFLVVSRFNRQDNFRPDTIQWLVKPVSTAELVEAVSRAVAAV